ncbi:glycosyltransferase family 87 protein [Trinickia sp. YCB016]
MSSISTRDTAMARSPLLAESPTACATRRPHWLNGERLRTYSIVTLACYAMFVLIYLFRALYWERGELPPLAMDFLPFWSTSFLALHGHAVDAYNVKLLTAVETSAISYPHDGGGILAWLYPPTFLLFVYPLALLPYKLAAVLFIGTTYGVFVKTIYTIVPSRQTLLVALAFPGAALVAIVGQNAFLTAALAGSGLVLLRRRPVAAGVIFGLLCMKPHLAVLFPLALLCSRSWRAFGAFAITAISTLAIAVFVFGVGTLSAFLHNAGMAAGYVETGRAALARMPTLFAMAKFAHEPSALAYGLQAASALFAAGAVCFAWGRESSYSLRAATLICASLLVSPYLYDYDLAWYGVLIAWYVKHAMKNGWMRGEREWLVLLWVMPLAGVLLVRHAPLQFMPLITAATLWMLVRRIAIERSAPPVLQSELGD